MAALFFKIARFRGCCLEKTFLIETYTRHLFSRRYRFTMKLVISLAALFGSLSFAQVLSCHWSSISICIAKDKKSFQEGANIIIIGGQTIGTISDVEVVSLDDSVDCLTQTPLPSTNQEMIAVVDSQGRPLACGGLYQPDGSCLVYDQGEWVDGPTMNYPRDAGPDSVLLSDGRWFISGNVDGPG